MLLRRRRGQCGHTEGIYSLYNLIIAIFLRHPGLTEAVGTGSLAVLAELVRAMSVEQGRMP